MYKNIVFDIGNVLIDLHLDKTKEGLRLISDNIDYNLSDNIKNFPFFYDFERGNISSEDFHKEFEKAIFKDVEFDKLKNVWNAMLGSFRAEMISLCLELKEKGFRTFVLSNTNTIHAKCFESYFLEEYGKSFHEYFEKVFYSHEMGERKPDAQIYESLIRKCNIKPSETLFIDDLPKNIEAAKKLGLGGLVFTPSSSASDIRDLIGID